MGTLLEFKTGAGESLLVEVEDPPRAEVTRGGRSAEAVVEAGASLEQVLSRLGPAIGGLVSQLRASAEWPGEVEVEFGVRLSVDSNVIIARAGGEANFRIALRWVEGK
jgi:Trypsin-co-occurring domain 1